MTILLVKLGGSITSRVYDDNSGAYKKVKEFGRAHGTII